MRLNDIEINKFFIIIICIQISLICLVALESVGINLDPLRQIIGFIFITFIPGFVILRLMRIHNIGTSKTILYAILISVFFMMIFAVIINFSLETLDVPKPLSLWNLLIYMNIFIFILSIIAYKFDKGEKNVHKSPKFRIDDINVYIFSILLIALSVVGTLILTYYNFNTISLFTFFIILSIFPLILLNKLQTSKFLLFSIALSVAFSYSLFATTLMAWNADYEYYFSFLTIQKNLWDTSIFNIINPALSITILAPIYSIILDLEVTWIYKIIYSFFYALIPFSLFIIYKSQMDRKEAYFAVLFFIFAVSSVYVDLILMYRRHIVSELFFVGIIMLIVENKISPSKKSILLILFIAALIISYYGVAYIGFILLTVVFIFSAILNTETTDKIMGNFKRRLNFKSKSLFNIKHKSILSLTAILFWIVLTIAWYSYVAGGASLENIVHIGNNVINNLNDFLNPSSRPDIVYSAIGMTRSSAGFLGTIYRVLGYLAELFIILGIFKLISDSNKLKFKNEYSILCLAAFVLLIFSIIIPNFIAAWNTYRVYNFVLIILAPMFILGGKYFFEKFFMILQFIFKRIKSINLNKGLYLKCTVVFVLIPLYLFNVGIVHDLSLGHFNINTVPSNQKLSYGGKMSNNDSLYYNQMEISGAEWLSNYGNDKAMVASDFNRNDLLTFWFFKRTTTISTKYSAPYRAYIYLGTYNIKNQELYVKIFTENNVYVRINDFEVIVKDINSRDKIFDSNGVVIYNYRVITN